jgi:lysophospholipase L1-like esterase
LAGLFLAALSTVLSVLVAEGVLRAFFPQPPSWLAVYREHPRLPFVVQADVHAPIDTGETHWTLHTDGRGYRIPAAGPSGAAPEHTLLLLGDSFSFGHGVDYEQTFGARLALQLGPRWRLDNAAVPGYGPIEYRQRLEETLAAGEHPEQLLVVLYLGNDFRDCAGQRRVPVVDGVIGYERTSLSGWLKRRSHLYRLASRAWHVVAGSLNAEPEVTSEELYHAERWEQGELKRGFETCAAELGALASLARGQRIPLLVAVIPTAETVAARVSTRPEGLAEGRRDLGLPARKTMRLLGDLGLPSVDLTDALAAAGAERVYLPFDGHLSPLGHERVAAEIGRPLIAEIPAASASTPDQAPGDPREEASRASP